MVLAVVGHPSLRCSWPRRWLARWWVATEVQSWWSEVPAAWHLVHLIRGSSGLSGSAGTLRIFMIPNLAALTAPPVVIARWCGPAASLRAAWNLSLFHLGCCAAVASARVDVAKCWNCVARHASRGLCWNCSVSSRWLGVACDMCAWWWLCRGPRISSLVWFVCPGSCQPWFCSQLLSAVSVGWRWWDAFVPDRWCLCCCLWWAVAMLYIAYENDVGVVACEQGALKVSTRTCLQKMADGMWCSQP